MQLNLHENIKKYRKEMGITQEGLAEAFGITVGAVSKWESGSTIPDIMTLMDLADFFDISVDTLLGYTISSKNVDDIIDRLEKLLSDGQYDEAILEAEKAIVRYPGNYRILNKCANAYVTVSAVKNFKKEYRERAFKLFEESLRYVDQNTGVDDNEMSVRYKIAELKISDYPNEAIREFQDINYRGAAEIGIAQAYRALGKKKETLDRYTRALSGILVQSIELATGMNVSLMSMDTQASYKEAADLMDWCISIVDATSNGRTSYLTKVKVFCLALKAINQSCYKDYDNMKKSLDAAYKLAKEYDKKPSNDFSDKIKFWHAAEDYKYPIYDNLGHGAVDGINSLFENVKGPGEKNVVKKMQEASKYWESINK